MAVIFTAVFVWWCLLLSLLFVCNSSWVAHLLYFNDQ